MTRPTDKPGSPERRDQNPEPWSHVPNIESFLQELYVRSTGLSVEPTSAQFSVLSQRVSVLSSLLGVASATSQKVSVAIAVETGNRLSADNILSNAISVLSQQLSIVSNQVSVLSQAVSVLSQGLSIVSNAASNALSVANAASNAASVVSQAVSVVSNALSNEISNRTSADNVLSNAISVISQQVSVLSQQVSVLSQAASVLSQQVSVLSQKVSAVGIYRVQGLSGLVSGTSTVNLAADAVEFWNSTDKSIHTVVSVVAVTNDVGLGAGVANGRDTAAIFPSSVWIHFYFVLDGATVKSRSSLTAPPTGPALQGTESAWAYAGAIFRGSVNNLVKIRLRGARMIYEAEQQALAAGSATVSTAIDLSLLIPPNTLHYSGQFSILFQDTIANSQIAMILELVSGTQYTYQEVTTAVANNNTEDTGGFTAANLSQTIRYYWNANKGTRSGFVYIQEYTVPNGDS